MKTLHVRQKRDEFLHENIVQMRKLKFILWVPELKRKLRMQRMILTAKLYKNGYPSLVSNMARWMAQNLCKPSRSLWCHWPCQFLWLMFLLSVDGIRAIGICLCCECWCLQSRQQWLERHCFGGRGGRGWYQLICRCHCQGWCTGSKHAGSQWRTSCWSWPLTCESRACWDNQSHSLAHHWSQFGIII